MQGGAMVEGLHLPGAQTQTDLDAPDFTDFGDPFPAGTGGAGRENDLLGGFDLVALKQPTGCVLHHVTVVGLGDALDQVGDVRLSRGLLGGGLLLFLLCSAGQEARRHHESQKQLVGVVGCKDQVCHAARDDVIPGADKDFIAYNGSEAIDLGAKLDLGKLPFLEGDLGIFDIGNQWSEWRNVGIGRDGSRMGNSFDQLANGHLLRKKGSLVECIPLVIFLPL